MLSVRTIGRFLVAGAVMFTVVALNGSTASARPKYVAVMSAMYPELAAKHGKNDKLTCTVCHPAEDNKKKKLRNNYGVALEKGLAKKNETDEDKIKEAIAKAEKEKSATEGKTFGDLIKELELPGTDEPANSDK